MTYAESQRIWMIRLGQSNGCFFFHSCCVRL